VILAVALVILASPAYAGFHAADQLYIPIVAATTGINASEWHSDLILTNVDDTDVDVAIIFLPSGLFSNSSRYNDRSLMLGGRADDGFGATDSALLDDRLADIPPGGTVVLEDVAGVHWGGADGIAGNGGLVIFAYESGSLQDDGTRVFRSIVAMSRIYNVGTIWQPDPDTEGAFIEEPATYGQTVPAVPWYELAYSEEQTSERDLGSEILLGGTEDSAYRYNFGILNASDPLTQLSILVQPFKADGSPFLDADGNEIRRLILVPPGAHLNYTKVLSSLFGLDPETDDLHNVTLKLTWSSFESTSAAPVPAFTSYGSLVDEVSNDPTTVLPSFPDTYDIDCVWNGVCPDAGGGTKVRPTARRPLEIPSR
jgi:hypothetical protein